MSYGLSVRKHRHAVPQSLTDQGLPARPVAAASDWGDWAGGDWAEAGLEPAVTELLDDPLVGLVMVRDAITIDDVRRVVEKARQQMAHAERVVAGIEAP